MMPGFGSEPLENGVARNHLSTYQTLLELPFHLDLFVCFVSFCLCPPLTLEHMEAKNCSECTWKWRRPQQFGSPLLWKHEGIALPSPPWSG